MPWVCDQCLERLPNQEVKTIPCLFHRDGCDICGANPKTPQGNADLNLVSDKGRNATYFDGSLSYPFTEQDSERAYNDWQANCGPNALAFALGLHIDKVRGAIPGFEEKRYTSPTMMKEALEGLGVKARLEPRSKGRTAAEAMFTGQNTLVRVQWCGPWTAPGANAKWAYGHTHWICCWLDITRRNESERTRLVFDVNGGVRTFAMWMLDIVPAITDRIKRADGTWFPTHAWVIQPREVL